MAERGRPRFAPEAYEYSPRTHRIIKVQTRRFRVRRQGSLRFQELPELRLSNGWLAAAGFDPGDYILVQSPELQTLVITLHRRANPDAPVGYKPAVVFRPLDE